MLEKFTKQAILAVFLGLLAPGNVRAEERPPEVYRGAPVVPFAKPVGEHRFRSPRSYEDTIAYYKKVLGGKDWQVAWKKIINTPDIRGQHIKNKGSNKSWEGVNVYESRGATFLFVVLSDEELARAKKAALKNSK